MKNGSLIGIGIGVALLGLGATMEGVGPDALMQISAILIIFGGTIGASAASFGIGAMARIPAWLKKAFMAEEFDMPAQVERLVGFADTARRDGLLALEAQLDQVSDDFTRKGLQLVVDGTDQEVVREILDLEIESMEKRHKLGEEMFKQAGGFAPTMGVLGAVLGLVHAMSYLSQPEMLGPAIAVAFIATLMGVGVANIFFLPVATRLKMLSEEEVELRAMTIEGILAVQAGENPRMVAEKLLSFVSPDQRAKVSLPGTGTLQAVDGARKAA